MSKVIASRTAALTETPFHYCPGCAHGIIHRLTAEVIDELGLQEKTVGVASVGCSVFAYDYFNVDMLQAAHGRAPAVATGSKGCSLRPRCLPTRVTGTWLPLGLRNRPCRRPGRKITVIFVNNANYGMTGGQQAPTTLLGQVTKTTPNGRTSEANGYPIRVCELLSTLTGAAYIARTAVFDPAHVTQTKKAIRKAFEVQEKGLGFSLVEVLGNCPTNWHLSPGDSVKWLKENMLPYYPLGEFKVSEEVESDEP